jgi:hypothetical protein
LGEQASSSDRATALSTLGLNKTSYIPGRPPIFKGYLPITNGQALEGFVDCVLKIRRCDFMAFAEEQSKVLVDFAKRMAQEAGAQYRFLQGHHRKDKLIDEMLRQRPIFAGLIGVLCCMETCPSFKLVYGKGRPRLINARRPQRVLYFYFMDKELGQIYVRLTTWFPFTVQIYVNGHSWLEKQMLKRRIGFNLRDNAFTALDDPEAAQKLADSFGHLKWRKILDRLVRQVNPLMKERWFRGYNYYWVVDQAEYATDLIFTNRESLAGLYSRLLDHAAISFSAKDILTFLGRRCKCPAEPVLPSMVAWPRTPYDAAAEESSPGMSSGPGPRPTRYREKHHACVPSADES